MNIGGCEARGRPEGLNLSLSWKVDEVLRNLWEADFYKCMGSRFFFFFSKSLNHFLIFSELPP